MTDDEPTDIGPWATEIFEDLTALLQTRLPGWLTWTKPTGSRS
jgi:hypothetical protein